jgi:hypothetical protein
MLCLFKNVDSKYDDDDYDDDDADDDHDVIV